MIANKRGVIFLAKCVSLLTLLLYNSTVLKQTLAQNVKFTLT